VTVEFSTESSLSHHGIVTKIARNGRCRSQRFPHSLFFVSTYIELFPALDSKCPDQKLNRLRLQRLNLNQTKSLSLNPLAHCVMGIYLKI